MVLRPAAVLLSAPLLLASAAGCGGEDGPAEVPGPATVADAPELLVVASDFAFAPDVLHLAAGEPVTVVLESSEGGHNLVVDAPGDGFRLPVVDEGEATRGSLRIDEPGTFELRCTVPGHAEQGMVGSVEVAEEPEP